MGVRTQHARHSDRLLLSNESLRPSSYSLVLLPYLPFHTLRDSSIIRFIPSVTIKINGAAILLEPSFIWPLFAKKKRFAIIVKRKLSSNEDG